MATIGLNLLGAVGTEKTRETQDRSLA